MSSQHSRASSPPRALVAWGPLPAQPPDEKLSTHSSSGRSRVFTWTAAPVSVSEGGWCRRHRSLPRSSHARHSRPWLPRLPFPRLPWLPWPAPPSLMPRPGPGGLRCLVLRLGTGDPGFGGHPVEQVEIGIGAQHIHPGITERAGVLVLLRASVHVRHRGQCLIGRQVAPGQPGRALLLAEQDDPRVPLLRLLPPPGGQARVDGQRGLLGQPQHLRVGLVGQLAEDQRLGPCRVSVGQVLERLDDRSRLRRASGCRRQARRQCREAAPAVATPCHAVVSATGPSRKARRPARSAATPATHPAGRRGSRCRAQGVVAADHLRDHAQLRRRGPRLDRRPGPQQPGQLAAVRAEAAPSRARTASSASNARHPTAARPVQAVPAEHAQPRVARRKLSIAGIAGAAVRARARYVTRSRLPPHHILRSMTFIT